LQALLSRLNASISVRSVCLVLSDQLPMLPLESRNPPNLVFHRPSFHRPRKSPQNPKIWALPA